MLLELTLRCDEECSHCLVSATRDSTRHMSDKVVADTVSYLRRLGKTLIQITGGEPTQHPDWFRVASQIADTQYPVTILSNGQWIDNPQKCKEVRDFLDRPNVISMQVTSYRKYYPRFERIKLLKPLFELVHPKIFVAADEEIGLVAYMGRARDNNITPFGKKYPGCANFLLVALQSAGWNDLHAKLISGCKLCVPTIDPEGKIHIGESWECSVVGAVNTSFMTMFDNARNISPCGKCGLRNPFLDPPYFLLKQMQKGNACVSYSPGSSSCSFVPVPANRKA